MSGRRFTRRERPFAAMHRERWQSLLRDPSKHVYLLSDSGKSTQRQFLRDIALVMDYLVSELEFRTRKVGVATRRGFLLRTWANVAEGTGLPVWRVKQCVSFAKQRGWLTSTQPRHNENGQWYGLASIKRISERYFTDLGLRGAFHKAKTAASETIKRMAIRTGVHVRYLLTPITLLRKFARRHDQSPLKR
ncbi:hypothetical protein OPW07_19590 [Vibrio europaeus]|uniref:hypothetical protein n=1 Tax=Vibrio europaeus TaxID=300876 RepID=UPI0018A70635|nr:hypothetical protein [Vibrio europaeus]MDC5811928.1 hypothetical protein [Vibrio europaeus]QPG34161.1 hypothetical protein IXK98_00085 [Vibrio europaeus]